ncbi:serine protease inhibitor Cvsi-2-like [Ruditapes philippinarum]|uniref:serine protease inhibitor Cvsi-2-like n=1 Tax=Ruditapes philippinarum TaxID=129788 RepID=UPI00295B99DA|nr:serine protease inhibitor Cvsi-2-like [Ruditapes philippinarum]
MHLSVALVLLVVAGTAYSELCTSTDDCRNHGTTRCEHNTHVFCLTSVNQCVCATDSVTNGQMCGNTDDCPSCHHGDRRHCVDGHCVCYR